MQSQSFPCRAAGRHTLPAWKVRAPKGDGAATGSALPVQAVLRMLEAIGSRENIPEALARAKDKKDPFRLMGFGHRVYKTFDPRCTTSCMHACGHSCLRLTVGCLCRARVMRRVCHEVLDHLNITCGPALPFAA